MLVVRADDSNAYLKVFLFLPSYGRFTVTEDLFERSTVSTVCSSFSFLLPLHMLLLK